MSLNNILNSLGLLFSNIIYVWLDLRMCAALKEFLLMLPFYAKSHIFEVCRCLCFFLKFWANRNGCMCFQRGCEVLGEGLGCC